MTIDEALDYIEDINSTVIWTKEQETDREFFENVAEWLEELKVLREKAKGDKWYQQGRADAIDECITKLLTESITCFSDVIAVLERLKGE